MTAISNMIKLEGALSVLRLQASSLLRILPLIMIALLISHLL